MSDNQDQIARLAAYAKTMEEFGAFHIVVGDYNIGDSHLRFCIDDTGAAEDDRAWGREMLALSPGDRKAVLMRAFDLPATYFED